MRPDLVIGIATRGRGVARTRWGHFIAGTVADLPASSDPRL